MSERFKAGDRVYLATAYWVNHVGDCDNDRNVKDLVVGVSVGTFHSESYENRVEVTWDGHPRTLTINRACLALYPPVTDEDMNQALQSIQDAYLKTRGKSDDRS